MGSVLSSRVKDNGKVVFEISLDFDEAKHLHGHIQNIQAFSEDAPGVQTHIAHRGKNEATKYFLIPRELRKKLNYESKTNCQRIDTKTKTVFIYVLDKFSM